MTPAAIILLVVGIGLIVVGYLRTRAPYSRLRALRAQDQNVARYNAWRGGVRDEQPDSATGAELQRQVRLGAGLGLIGIAAIFTALVMR
jgi:hypothetical protein